MSSTQAMPASERCHPAAVEFLLFLPRDRAVVMRRHIMTDPQFRDVSVSRLYRVRSAWAVTVCSECRTITSSRRQAEHRTRAVRTA